MKPTKEQLEKWYLTEKLGSHRIAKRYDVAKITVLRWLRAYKIPLRTGKEAHRHRGKDVWPRKGKIKHVSGYVMLWNHSSKKYEWEHAVVWKKHHGEIEKGYLIHHKNEIKHDNRIENLRLMTTTEHLNIHREKINRAIRKGFKNGRKVWNKGMHSEKCRKAALKAWITKRR